MSGGALHTRDRCGIQMFLYKHETIISEISYTYEMPLGQSSFCDLCAHGKVPTGTMKKLGLVSPVLADHRSSLTC